MMAMKMHWWVQKYVMWSEASNSQRLHCKLIPAGHDVFPIYVRAKFVNLTQQLRFQV